MAIDITGHVFMGIDCWCMVILWSEGSMMFFDVCMN